MYYTAVEQGDALTVMDELESLFEATCCFYALMATETEADEIELGEYIDDEMEPILQSD